jgi:hypothetical protein
MKRFAKPFYGPRVGRSMPTSKILIANGQIEEVESNDEKVSK